MNKFKLVMIDALKMLGILLFSAIVAVFLLTLSYLLPVQSMMKNASKSNEILLSEGDYKRYFDNESYQLDNFTDATMINEAINSSNESAIKKAMLNFLSGWGTGGLNETLNGNKNDFSYSRYWHGYLIFLKPLLMIFGIKGIRILNLILQVLLVTIICYFLFKKQKALLASYLVSIFAISPFVISQSMQFSCIYYLMNISFLVILLFYEKLKAKNYLKFAFLIFGILTSFFDLLTFPLATLLLPLTLVIFFDDSKSFKEKFKTIFLLGLFWMIGYFGFWILKWCVGSLLTGKNLFADAMSQAKVRSSEEVGGYSKLQVLFAFTLNTLPLQNIKCLVLLIVSLILISLLFIFKKSEFKISKNQIFAFLIVAILPIVWYTVLSNHSFVHYWFTFRAYIGTIFAVLSIFAYGFKYIKLKKGKTYEKENSSDNSVLQ